MGTWEAGPAETCDQQRSWMATRTPGDLTQDSRSGVRASVCAGVEGPLALGTWTPVVPCTG